MIKFKRLTIALLALLSISATAWAQTWTSGGCNVKLEGTTLTVSKSASGNGRMADYNYYYERGWNNNASSVKNLVIEEGVVYLGKNAFGKFTSITEVTIPSSVTSLGENALQQCWALKTVTVKAASCTLGNNAFFDNGEMKQIYVPRDKVTDYKNADGWRAYQGIILAAPAAPGEVVINDAKTEAEFTMPDYDLTVTYALKRDMAVEMSVSVQDAQNNSRFRVEEKQGGGFQPVGLNMQQVLALFNVHDDIENTDLTLQQDYYGLIFSLDDNDLPTGDGVLLNNFNFAPGRYAVRAIGQAGSNYVGTTELSNVFTLFQGYEVTIAAGEYATYYKDEALYVEDTDAQLYTITAVNGDKATATELTTAPANTPLLVKNNGSETKTILLIPTTTDDDIDFYSGFKGTLEGQQIPASDATTDRYAFNGQQFVWVKNPVSIAANKCWLAVPVTGVSSARALSIVFDSETTGIGSVLSGTTAEGDWYDINGRKHATKPTRKGVYILNGKKVVIK
mgnify:CR=1 FL=1